MTCKDCMHYEVCIRRQRSVSLDPMKCGYKCPEFKNKADFAKVVKCKECKHFITDTFKRTMCNRTFTMFEMNENDFCSYGEKKGE